MRVGWPRPNEAPCTDSCKAAFLLPLASGSAPAAKGVMTEMSPPHQRQDAISAITLVESAAMLITQGLFGLIFAAFSELDKPNLTFFCNAVSHPFVETGWLELI
jgi:hypothetical protein